MEVSKRNFEALSQRVSQLENKIRSLENLLKVYEKRLKPSEIYRTVKQMETEMQLGHPKPFKFPGEE